MLHKGNFQLAGEATTHNMTMIGKILIQVKT